ncbi:MAG: START domain-containing protein [Bdellovibrionales bacterium]|nr:START domain-containing protein [Bdellovibrionales bacterium]
MKILISTFILLFTITSTQASVPTWQQIKVKQGISVFKKEIPKSKLVAFKGEAIIEASAGKIIHVLKDNTHKKDWVDRLLKSEVLEKNSEYEQVMYQVFNAPWPVSNRDFVYRANLTRDTSGVITLHMNSIDHNKSPKTIGVRADLIKSIYKLTPIGPNKTKLEVEIQSDPKGLLPKWVVNIIQRSWPLKTLQRIRNQVKKPFVRDIPLPPIQG